MSAADDSASGDFEAPSTNTSRHGWLLAALVLLIFESSTRGLIPLGQFGYSAFFTGVLIAGIHSSGARGPMLWGAIALGLPTVVFQWGSYYSDSTLLMILNLSSSSLFLIYSCFAILKQIMGAKVVTGDTVIGGIVVYLLIGIVFLMLYLLVEYFQPGSLAGIERIEVHEGQGIPELLYFSFVTLTTLGYGDIQPVGDVMRSVAMMEAVIGQLYLTVLIAWLVGVHISQRRERG
jgi:voltage-gated potassium channel